MLYYVFRELAYGSRWHVAVPPWGQPGQRPHPGEEVRPRFFGHVLTAANEGHIDDSIMSMMAGTSRASAPIQILRTHDLNELDRITSPTMQAVVYTPTAFPDWLDEVAEAVEQEFLQIPRTILPTADFRKINDWLENNLPQDVLACATRFALKRDILSLAERLARVSGAERFYLRIFTGAPTTNCGFHVDTVSPGTPKWGLLRVYNGAGTEYVHPEDVVNMQGFYRYLTRRERLERECSEARRRGETQRAAKAERELQLLDQERPFLTPTGNVHNAPSRSIVAFKHLDVSLHWSDHSKALAWIHCSPMTGKPRLVVNVTGAPSGRGPTPLG